MPGRTPSEAFSAFVDPLREALSCLAAAKITTGPKSHEPFGVRVWSLNLDRGVVLRDGWHFEAEMHYEIIPADAPAPPWRVTTRAYRYKVSHCDKDLVRMHWHPSGKSPFTTPHFHIPMLSGGTGGESGHLPIGRVSFEDAVQWVIVMSGQHARADWQEVLDRTRSVHVEHRTWSDAPPQRA